MSAYMNSRWWLYALPVVLCLGLSVININFIFVAIVLLFLVFTMALFIVVVYYGLVPESRFSTNSREIAIDEKGVLLKLKKPIYAKEENTPTDEKSIQEYETEEVLVSWNRIKCMEIKTDCLHLVFKRPKFSFIIIPFSSFTETRHLHATMELIRSYLT